MCLVLVWFIAMLFDNVCVVKNVTAQHFAPFSLRCMTHKIPSGISLISH